MLRAVFRWSAYTVAAVLALELLLRPFGYGSYVLYEPDEVLLWVPRARQSGRTVEGHKRISINGAGLRYTEEFTKRDSGETRVFTFGNSVTMGWGVDDNRHYSAVLESMLVQETGRSSWRVASAGVNAYPLTLCVRRFARFLAEGYQIDVAVLAYTFNPQHEVYARLEGEARQRLLGRVAFKGMLRRSAVYNFLIEDVLREAVYYRLRERLTGGSWEAKTESTTSEDAGSGSSAELSSGTTGGGTSAAALLQMQEQARSAGVKLVFLLLGSQGQRDELHPEQSTFAEFARSQGISLVDVISRFATENHDELFLDHVHPNDRGHREIARALVPAVLAAAADK